MFGRGLKTSIRGNMTVYAALFVIALVAAVVVILLAPAFLITMIVLLLAGVVFIVFKGHPYGLVAGVLLVVIAILFAVTAQGQGLSLALTGNA